MSSTGMPQGGGMESWTADEDGSRATTFQPMPPHSPLQQNWLATQWLILAEPRTRLQFIAQAPLHPVCLRYEACPLFCHRTLANLMSTVAEQEGSFKEK